MNVLILSTQPEKEKTTTKNESRKWGQNYRYLTGESESTHNTWSFRSRIRESAVKIQWKSGKEDFKEKCSKTR